MEQRQSNVSDVTGGTVLQLSFMSSKSLSQHMMKASLIVWIAVFLPLSSSLSIYKERPGRHGWVAAATRQVVRSSRSSSVDELDEERRANLFQFLLRDLQVEGVPLLEVDVDQPQTLHLAIWTTLAELSNSVTPSPSTTIGYDEARACLVLESISMDTIKRLVEYMADIKRDSNRNKLLPGLGSFNVSLVGKGIGPAVLLEATGIAGLDQQSTHIEYVDNIRCLASVKMFMDRMEWFSSSGTSTDDLRSTPIYRVCPYTDVCNTMSSLWNGICEMVMTQQPVVVAFPALFFTSPTLYWEYTRFVQHSIAELWSTAAAPVELAFLHPMYNRDGIEPMNDPIPGHLPPTRLWRSLITTISSEPTTMDYSVINYHRRSPIPIIVIMPRMVSHDRERLDQIDRQWDLKVISNILGLGEERLEELLQSEINLWRNRQSIN